VFELADALALDIYQICSFPPDEQYGLRMQIRRAAVSSAANIVEGCARDSTREYVRFLIIALGSSSETRYLLDISRRLGFVQAAVHDALEPRNRELVRRLQRMVITRQSERE
jgi:four helix bundle protein